MLHVLLVVVLSIGAFISTYISIPNFAPILIAAGLSGKDLSKRKQPVVAESLGLVCGTVFLVTMFINLAIRFGLFLGFSNRNTDHSMEFPHMQFSMFLTAILSNCSMLLLGFVDDVLNLKWRYKLIFPTLASMPLLIVYYINGGGTTISMPTVVQFLIGTSINIKILYYFYMSMLAIFCTNAINIYAGINGLESGQTVIIAFSVCVFNLFEMNGLLSEAHFFSFSIMLPFAFISLALFMYNKYPAKVFVGDTFTYFAGMTFAELGIIGHFSKTLLLFFIPQILNFLYSVPQIFRIIPCPRHRIPKYNQDTDKMTPSYVKFKQVDVNPLLYQILILLNKLHIVDLKNVPDSEGFVTMNNLTLINFVLLWTGPLNEGFLTKILLIIQVLGSLLAFLVRYPLGNYLFKV